MVFNPILKTNVHYCGDGYKGTIIEANNISFCGLCGREFTGANL